ncbi:MAG: phosphoglycolate phosphatase [Rhizobiaceae bacterium]|nr:phosphoglycolate phosphatase [Rhizobiaceae bacterium]
MTRPIIVFDLDGTLVETAPDLLDSLNHCLGIAKMAAVDEARLRSYVGMGGKVMIERAFAAQGAPLTEDHLAELLVAFLEHYTDNIPGRSLAFPGVEAALSRFEAAGWIMAVCTNKYEALSRKLLDALGLSPRFAAICGQDTFAFRKPDPRHLIETIRLAGGDPERAVMVGDSFTDIETAKRAGIPVVAVDFGYTDRHVREFEPSRIISHFDALTVAMAEKLVAGAA